MTSDSGRRSNFSKCIAFALFLTFMASPVHSRSPGTPIATKDPIVFVNQRAKGKGNGTSWKNAFTDLQVALSRIKTGQIWVAAGTYKPDRGTGSRDSTFKLDSTMEIYVGFKGNEKSLSQANPSE